MAKKKTKRVLSEKLLKRISTIESKLWSLKWDLGQKVGKNDPAYKKLAKMQETALNLYYAERQVREDAAWDEMDEGDGYDTENGEDE